MIVGDVIEAVSFMYSPTYVRLRGSMTGKKLSNANSTKSHLKKYADKDVGRISAEIESHGDYARPVIVIHILGE